MSGTELKTLLVDFSIKAVAPLERMVEGFCAVSGNLDRVGDVIDRAANVKAAQTNPADVGVFVGHQSADLPIGRCIGLRADGDGLWCKTYIFPTQRGDDLIQTIQALQASGSTLGLSIGYRTDDYAHERRDGKVVRVLKAYTLAEYSFAARQAIANPQALVTSVKDAKQGAPGTFDAAHMALMPALRDAYPDRWAEIEDLYPDRVIYSLCGSGGLGRAYYQASYTLDASGAATLGDPVEMVPNWTARPDAEDPPTPAKTVRSAAPMPNDLPDFAFLFIESGGALDDSGKTVPRSNRHLAYRDAEGKIDLATLQAALAALPETKAAGLDAEAKTVLSARVRRMADQVLAGKAADDASPEWHSGAAVAVRAIGYGLLDASETIATELKAMSLLGSDTKGNGRLRPELRQKLADLASDLSRLVRHAELIDAEQDGAAQVALNRSRLQLLEV